MTQTQACSHLRASVGLDAAYCPDCRQEFSPWSKEYKHLLNQDNSLFAACSAECPAYAVEGSQKPDSTTCFESASLLKQTHIAGPSSPDSTPAPPVTPTSEPSPQSEESSIVWQEDRRARELVEPIPEAQDLMTNAQDCGEKCIASSTSAVLDLSSGKMLPLPDTQNQDNECLPSEEFCGILPASGIAENGKLLAQLPLAHPTNASASSLLPTPMAHSRASTKYRPPGQDKLEQALRSRGMIPPGHVSTPEFREWMQGLPQGWTDISQMDGGPFTYPPLSSALPNAVFLTELAVCKPSEIAAHRNRQLCAGVELHTSLDCFKPETRVCSERTVDLIGQGDKGMGGQGDLGKLGISITKPSPPHQVFPSPSPLVDSLIPPTQLQLLKEPPTMIALAPTQNNNESATHTCLSDNSSGSKVQFLTDADEPKVDIAEPELQSQPEPEPMPVDVRENQANFSPAIAPEIQQTPDYLKQEEIERPSDEINFLVDSQSGADRDRTNTSTDTSAEAQFNDDCSTATHVSCEIVNDSNSLTESEQLECKSLEETIERGLQSFYEMGKALSRIRSHRLYRTYGTFEQYCSQRWEMSRRAAYQLIDAAAVVDNVRNCAQIFPANEAQARPLAKLETKEQQQQAWLYAVETAPGGKVTAEHVASVVKEILPLKPKKSSRKQHLGTFKIDAGSEGCHACETVQSKNDSHQLGSPTEPLDDMNSLMSDVIKPGGTFPGKISSKPISVKNELSQKALELGLPAFGEQVLPDVRRNNISPADVDDRPNVYSPKPPIPVDTNEICTNFIGSIEYLSHEHIIATVSELATRINPQKLDSMGNEELQLFVNKLNLLAETAIALLTKRHNPSYCDAQCITHKM